MDQSVLLCGFDQIDKDKSTPWERRHLAGCRQDAGAPSRNCVSTEIIASIIAYPATYWRAAAFFFLFYVWLAWW